MGGNGRYDGEKGQEEEEEKCGTCAEGNGLSANPNGVEGRKRVCDDEYGLDAKKEEEERKEEKKEEEEEEKEGKKGKEEPAGEEDDESGEDEGWTMGEAGLGGAGGGKCLTMTVQPDCQFKLPIESASSQAWT
jgi:hypothetical protein